MKNKILSIIIAVFICSTSCDDFLNQSPKHSLTLENSVTSYADAKNIVNGIYGVYKNSSYLGGYLASNAHCMAGMWQYDLTMYNMGYTQSSNNSIINSVWSSLYQCINAANAAIQGVSNLDEKFFPSAEVKNQLIAEARCFRGYCNLQLLWFFGHWFDKTESPYGILYRDKIADVSNLMTERSTVGESYQYIIDDLKFAEKNALKYSSARRMSKQFAQALLAKLYLVRGWEGDYNESLSLVNTLLGDTSTPFSMETDLEKFYQDGWDSKETLFSRYLGDHAQGSGHTTYEFLYSYGLFYDNKFTDIPQDWLENDVRNDIIFGNARAPETWDESRRDGVLTKLYHRGRYEGRNDMYAAYIFRYIELYLMKSELLARTKPSDIPGALAPLNEMRSKYTNPIMPPITGITSHQQLMDTIYKEYVVSLFMENETPWFASVRFEKDGKPWVSTMKPEVNFNKNHYCWPIPDAEIKAHANPIEQNPELK